MTESSTTHLPVASPNRVRAGTTGAGVWAMRTGLKLTQRGLAERAGVSHSYLSMVEAGREPSAAWRWRVTTALTSRMAELRPIY